MARSVCVGLALVAAIAAGGLTARTLTAGDSIMLHPVADGTIVDGGSYGPFDGVPDAWDWTFNQSGYEGAITLTSGPGAIEHRLVWEYNLQGIPIETPIGARLYFYLRGAPIYPFPDVYVHVYAYPANLQENPSDFQATPANFQGSVRLQAFQPTTRFSVDVSKAVTDAALDVKGSKKVAFRFQIDPGTENPSSQAFLDAVDTDPMTKPFLLLFKAGSRLADQ